MVAEIEQKNMSKESPDPGAALQGRVGARSLEGRSRRPFQLLKTYPICRWSGELGPKIKQGDRQAPEGFYTITPGLMNPNSSYYLAINIGFPNAYDQANGRTGQFLMIHGDCSSAGCYAMTDEQIAEIYALARESFFGGQRSFQIQAYPFRMTPLNMAKHRNSPHMAFWRMLKQGNDHFEVSRREPKVEVCDKRYVFDAETNGKFSPAGACPPYQVSQELASAVAEKQKRDERQMAEYISKGTPTVPVVTRTDGGMHPTFLAAFQKPYTDASGVIRTPGVSTARHDPGACGAAARARTAERPEALAQPSLPQQGIPPRPAIFSEACSHRTTPSRRTPRACSIACHDLSAGRHRIQRPRSQRPRRRRSRSRRRPRRPPRRRRRPRPLQLRPTNAGAIRAAAPKAATPEAKPEPKPESPPEAKATAAAEPRPSSSAGLLNGAQPTVPTGSFSNRWGCSATAKRPSRGTHAASTT